MGEILFRMWDDENQCYHCDWCGNNPNFTFYNKPNKKGVLGYISFLTLGGNDGDCEYMEDKDILQDSIIEQYTGLKDKNGTRIFEGDVIASGGAKHTVIWCDKEAGYASKMHTSDDSFQTCGISQNWINECSKVIIGNIHEVEK